MSRLYPLLRPLFAVVWRIAGWKHNVENAQKQIIRAVLEWPGITQQPHRFGGIEFCIGTREIGHIHGDWLVDIPFPTKVRDEVVAAGLAEPHHILPRSGWISRYLRKPDDVHTAVTLLRRSYDIAIIQHNKRGLPTSSTTS